MFQFLNDFREIILFWKSWFTMRMLTPGAIITPSSMVMPLCQECAGQDAYGILQHAIKDIVTTLLNSRRIGTMVLDSSMNLIR